MGNWKKAVGRLEVKMCLAIGLCLLAGRAIPQLQAITAGITALLCLQSTPSLSWKIGLNRLAVTAISGGIGVLVALADVWLANDWAIIPLVMAGLALTMVACRLLARGSAMSDRVGGISFLLVSLAQSGTQRIPYALYRLGSTLFGVLAVLAVAGLFSLLSASIKDASPAT